MPIKVACQCGQKFTAKDELAGKRVKCPKCGSPLAIPQAAGRARPAAASGTKTAGKTVAPAKAGPSSKTAARTAPSAPGGGIADLLDEVGIAGVVPGAKRCPSCQAAMKSEAILCIECGYNLQSGRKITTMGASKSAVSSGTPMADVLAKAEQTLEEDSTEERKAVSQGAPWWVLLLLLVAVIGFGAGMMTLSPPVVLRAFGYGALVLGAIIAFVGGILVLIAAFSISLVQGLLVLLVPFYAFLFALVYWDDCAGKAIIWFGGLLLELLGAILLLIAPLMESDKQQSAVPPPAPQAVATLEG